LSGEPNPSTVRCPRSLRRHSAGNPQEDGRSRFS
jgi:hypothetical protein